MPLRHWAELTSPEIAALAADAIAVLPIAATEQHGPHLPLGTDTLIAQAYLDRVAALAPAPETLLLPTLAIGLSPEHQSFAGTLTVAPETFLRQLAEIGASVARAGVRRLLIVSSHGGNSGAMEIAARELRIAHGMFVAFTAWARLGYPRGLFDADELAHGIHGGEIETAIMMAAYPQLVRRDALREFPSAAAAFGDRYAQLRLTRPGGFGWLAEDLNPHGVVGNAARATAEQGHAALDHGARAFAALLEDVARFPLPG